MDKENIVYLDVFPAPAGMSPATGGLMMGMVNVPRTCGDNFSTL